MQEDKPLTSRFDNFSAEPSASVWKNIESQLAKKKKRRLIFWWTSALAATVVTGFILFPFFSHTFRTNSSQELSKTKQAEKKGTYTNNKVPTKRLINKMDRKIISEDLTSTFQPNTPLLKPILSNFKANSNKKFSIGPKQETRLPKSDYVSANTTPKPKVGLKEKTVPKDSEIDSIQKAKNDDTHTIIKDPVVEINTVKVKKNRWEVGLFLGVARGKKTYQLPSPTPPVFASNSNNGSANLQEANNLDGNVNFEQTSLPFQIQLIVGRNLGQKFRLTSGIGFGIYRIKTRLIQPDEFVKSQPTLAGQLPFMLDFKIIDRPKWEWTMGSGILMGYQNISLGNEFQHQISTNLQWQTAIRYKVKGDWSISFQPHYRYRLFDNDTAKTIFYRNHLYGLNVGIVKRL